MLIKSALDNEDADARLSAWTKYTRASREVLVADPDMIREAITEGDLDLMLRTAAQRAGIPLPRSAGSKLIDAAIKLKIPKLLSYSFSVWSPMLAPIATAAELPLRLGVASQTADFIFRGCWWNLCSFRLVVRPTFWENYGFAVIRRTINFRSSRPA